MRLILKSLLVFLLSFNVMAQTIEQAQELYRLRAENKDNAAKSAEMYGQLAEKETNEFNKSALLSLQAHSWYYVAYIQTDRDGKLKFFNQGKESGEAAYKLIEGKAETKEEKEILAKAYYEYSANLAKWGETKGVLKALSQWKGLEKILFKIEELGMHHVENFGVHRILGRAYFKLPAIYGGKKASFENLKEAFDNTKNGHDVSTHGLNNLYYAELLAKIDKKDEAIAILKSFIEKDPETLDPERIPETKDEIEMAKQLLKDM